MWLRMEGRGEDGQMKQKKKKNNPADHVWEREGVCMYINGR